MTAPTNQELEAYLPVYDTIPEKWEESREILVEYLKKISNIVNTAEIGWFLDQELLSGKQFIPTATNSQEYRSVFRKVIDMGNVSVGANTAAHGIQFDSNFTLLHLFISATNSTGLNAATYVAPEVDMDATNINFNSPSAYDRAYAVCEYILEV